MQIDTKEIVEYIQYQKMVFEALQRTLPSDFNAGTIAGLDLISLWVRLAEDRISEDMARHLDRE